MFFAHVLTPNEANRSFTEMEVAASEWQQSLQKQLTPSSYQAGSGGAGL